MSLHVTPTRIYLTGFMGSGKSTVGAILANVLGYAFEDLDATVAERVGMSVQAFFETHGEAAFRAVEREVLMDTAGRERLVVATGGGALAQPDSMAWARGHGTVVYLALGPAALLSRLTHLNTPRPLLLGPDGQRLGTDALRARAETLMAQRDPVYRKAHIVVPADRLAVGQTVEAVARALRRYGGRRASGRGRGSA